MGSALLALAMAAAAPDVSLAWTFGRESSPSLHRPAIEPEGTIYLADGDGRLYAIQPGGRQRWVYDAARTSNVEGGDSGNGPVVQGRDGTLYFPFNPVGPLVELHAVTRDGAHRWTFRVAARSTIAGPAVGPDGNIYVAHAESGRGLLVIAPDGSLVRSNPGAPVLQDRSSLGSELVFGPRAPGEPATQLYLALDVYELAVRHARPSLFGFDLLATQVFRTPVGRLSGAGGQRQGQPVVGPSGTVYLSTSSPGQGWGLYAFSPDDGAPRWNWYEVPGHAMSEPAVGPDETIYVVQNLGTLLALSPQGEARWAANLKGEANQGPTVHPAGLYVAVTAWRGDELLVLARDPASGAAVWEFVLPRGDGERLDPITRVSFSPDGRRLYVQAEVMGAQGPAGWRLFALDVARCPRALKGCPAAR